MNRYLEATIGGFVSAYNITVGFIGSIGIGLTHAAVNAWLSTASLIVGIAAGILTIRNLMKKK